MIDDPHDLQSLIERIEQWEEEFRRLRQDARGLIEAAAGLGRQADSYVRVLKALQQSAEAKGTLSAEDVSRIIKKNFPGS